MADYDRSADANKKPSDASSADAVELNDQGREVAEYRREHAEAIGAGITAYLTLHSIETVVLGATGAALEVQLDALLGKSTVDRLVAKGRAAYKPRPGDDRRTWIARHFSPSPAPWSPTVATELGAALRAKLAQPESNRAAVQRRSIGPAPRGDVRALAASGAAGANARLPHVETIQRAFGKHDVMGVRAAVGGSATAATRALGARAYAIGEAVAFASDPDLHTAAHEAAHVIQQRAGVALAGGIDQPGDEHERHADEVADAVVGGRPAEALLDRYPMRGASTAAVQRKADDKKADPDAEKGDIEIPSGRNFVSSPGTGSIWANRAWLETDPQYAIDQRAPTLVLEMLEDYQRHGGLTWATPEGLHKLANTAIAQHRRTVARFLIGADAYTAVGLPPLQSFQVFRSAGGLKIALQIDLATEGEVLLTREDLERLILIIEGYTHLSIDARIRARLPAMSVHVQAGAHVAVVVLQQSTLRGMFGAEVWDRWSENRQATEVAGSASEAAMPASLELTVAERARLEAWLATHMPHRGDGAATQLSRRLLAVVDRIEQSKYKDAILKALADRATKTDKGLDVFLLERVVQSTEIEAERLSYHDAAEPTIDPTFKLDDPIIDAPIPGAFLTQHSGLVMDGDDVRFEVVIPWKQMALDAQTRERLAKRPWHAEVDFVFQSGSRIERATVSSKGGTLEHTQTLRLPKGVDRATWTAIAFVRSSQFQPTRVETAVDVATEAVRMVEAVGEVLGGKLPAGMNVEDHDFNIGALDDKISQDADDHGLRFSGPLGFTARTSGERAKARQDEIAQLKGVSAYLDGHPGVDLSDARDAIADSIKHRQEEDKAIRDDEREGRRMFDVRATFLSHDDDVSSGPLDVYGAVDHEIRVTTTLGSPSGGKDQVHVRLRDQSRRFDTDVMAFDGYGDTFEQALEAAFVKLAKQYPKGRVALFAEEQDPTGTKATGKSIGFELNTSSTIKTVRKKVFHPIAQVAIAAATAAIAMVFPPAAVVAVVIGVAYNTASTIDDLATKSENHTLTDRHLSVSLGMIALSVLPFVKQLKVLQGATKTLFAIDAAGLVGQVLLMQPQVAEAMDHFEAENVGVIARMYADLLALEKSTHASDPALTEKRAEIERQAQKFRNSLHASLTSALESQAMVLIPGKILEQLGGHGVLGVADHSVAPEDNPSIGRPVHETDWAPLHDELSQDAPKSPSPTLKPQLVRGPTPVAPAKPADHDSTEHKPAPPRETQDAIDALHITAPDPNRRPGLVRDVDGMGKSVAEAVGNTTYEGQGVFKVETPTGAKSVEVRRTKSGIAKIMRGAAHIVVEIPTGLAGIDLERAVVGKLTELRSQEARIARGESATTSLNEHVAAHQLSPEDVGKVAELRLLEERERTAREAGNSTEADELRRASVRLREQLGVVDHTPASEARRALVEAQLNSGRVAAAEARSLARIRQGTPGHIRSEAELSTADVARSLNAQLQSIKPGEVDAMLSQFPAAQQAHAREVLARASGFGRMEGLDSLRAALEPHLDAGKKLYTPGSGSLADNVAYVAGKGTFKANPKAIRTTGDIRPGTIVILDGVVLARIKGDPVFAQSLVDNHAVLLEPRGFNNGINMFNGGSTEVIARRTSQLLERANAIQASHGGTMAFDDAITAALDEGTASALNVNPALTGLLEVVDPASHPDFSNQAIASQLSGNAGITEGQLEAALAQVSEGDRPYLRELLAQQSEVFSARRISNDLLTQHGRLMDLARKRGIDPANVYYFIPEGEKSYGMVAMAYREATGTDAGRFINGSLEVSSRRLGPDTMLVILDDVAGSGKSLDSASIAASSGGYRGQVVISPIVSTETANEKFIGTSAMPNSGIVNHRPNTSYLPTRVMQDLKHSHLFKNLSPTQQARLVAIIGDDGFGHNGLSMVFPYMAPDNNNAFFGDQIAHHFIANDNKSASKTGGWYPHP